MCTTTQGFLDPDELGIFLQQKYGIVLDDAAQDDAAKAMDENESGCGFQWARGIES